MQVVQNTQVENRFFREPPLKNNLLQQIIEENSALFWYIPEDRKKEVSADTVVEFILNYGDYNACAKLLNALGTQEVAKIFFSHIHSERRKQNYFPEIIRYFTDYFHRHAPGNPE